MNPAFSVIFLTTLIGAGQGLFLALFGAELAGAADHPGVGRGFLAVGGLVVLAGILIAPLPGPGGIPVIVVGLMIMLRNSFAARRQFVRFQRAHPKLIFPIRRLLRKEPEVLQVAWQQALRMERLVIPRSWRVASRARRALKRRHRAKMAAKAAKA